MRVKLSDVCVEGGIQTGPFGAQLHQSDYSEWGTPVCMPVNLVDGSISDNGIARVPEEHVERLSRYKVKCGDLLYARRGDVGRGSLVGAREDGWLCGTGCLKVTPDPSKIDSRYLFYLTSLPEAIGWLVNHAKGTTMLNLNTGILSSLPLDIEDNLEKQRRIADVLSAYDELIENNRRQIKLLEEAAQRLYKDWFVDLKFPGHQATPVIDGLPEGWERGTLLDLVDVVRGCSYSSDEIMQGEKTLINLGNLAPFGGFRFGYEKPFSGKSSEDQVVAKGDVVMGLTEQAIGLAGYAALLPAVPDGSVISADLVKIAPKEGVPTEFVYALLRYGRLSELISPLANGTKIKHLRPQSLTRATTQIPSLELMQCYSAVVCPAYEQIDVCQQQIAAAREARDRLLPKLMSGEIEV